MGRTRRERTAIPEEGGWGTCICGNYQKVERSESSGAGQAEQDG